MAEQRVVIVGAYGGIGQALTAQLSEQGAECLLVGRDQSKLAALANQYGHPYQVCDASDMAAFDQCLTDFIAQHGEITGVVNLPGSILLKPCHLLTETDWQQTITTNLTTAFVVAHAVTKHMLKMPSSIVFMSTAATLIGLPNHEAIAAAKAGINGLMHALSATYAKNNLRFNCVAPGLVDTPLAKPITGNDKALAVSTKAHALGRIGQAEDISRMIAFLLDPNNSWITGQVIAVDGGLSSVKQMGS